MTLERIQIIKHGKVNDICICRDIKSPARTLYTVLAIRDHRITKSFLEICGFLRGEIGHTLVDEFSCNGEHILVFPYVKERPLKEFFVGEKSTLDAAEEACSSLVLACIQSALPYPILYLALKQGQVHIAQDMKCYLGFQFDLEFLDPTRRERDCVYECAKYLLDVLEPFADRKAESYIILKKRVDNMGYQRFAELYKDITISSSVRDKITFIIRLRLLWEKNKDRLFQLLMFFCVLVAVVALIAFVCQMLLGDVPFLRVFFNNFRIIGTENLYRK